MVDDGMLKLKGLPASPGIAIGKAFVYGGHEEFDIANFSGDADAEVSKFKKALEETKSQVAKLRDKVEREIGKNEAAIFEAHLMILDDPTFTDKVVKYIKEDRLSAEKAVEKASEELIEMFKAMESEYFRSRADDIKDLRNRIINNLRGRKQSLSLDLKEPSIVFAKELLPSDTARMDKKKVLAFVTEIGGITSHAAIVARALRVPAVVSVSGLMKNVRDGVTAIVDGYKGLVIIDPVEEVLREYSQRK